MLHVLADDYNPPAPWRTVYFRLFNSGGDKWYAPQQRQTAVAGLTDEELWWIGEVVLTELARRRDGTSTIT